MQGERLFRARRDAQAASLTSFREGCMRLLATVRPQPHTSLQTQPTLIFRGERMNGEYAIRTNVSARTFVLASLPIDDRDDFARPEGAFIWGCHTDLTRYPSLLLQRRRRSPVTFAIIRSSSAPPQKRAPARVYRRI